MKDHYRLPSDGIVSSRLSNPTGKPRASRKFLVITGLMILGTVVHALITFDLYFRWNGDRALLASFEQRVSQERTNLIRDRDLAKQQLAKSTENLVQTRKTLEQANQEAIQYRRLSERTQHELNEQKKKTVERESANAAQRLEFEQKAEEWKKLIAENEIQLKTCALDFEKWKANSSEEQNRCQDVLKGYVKERDRCLVEKTTLSEKFAQTKMALEQAIGERPILEKEKSKLLEKIRKLCDAVERSGGGLSSECISR